MRIAYRVGYVLCLAGSHVAAWLAADYRALAGASGPAGAAAAASGARRLVPRTSGVRRQLRLLPGLAPRLS